MLLDPLNILHGFTPSFTGGVATTFRRTGASYVSTDGPFSLDQPATLLFKPNRRESGISTYEGKASIAKNVAPINGIAQQDDILRCSIRLTGNNRSFTSADYANILMMLAFQFHAHMARINAGEY